MADAAYGNPQYAKQKARAAAARQLRDDGIGRGPLADPQFQEDVFRGLVGETPGEMAFNAGLGMPGKGLKAAGMGVAALMGADDAESAGAGAVGASMKTIRARASKALRDAVGYDAPITVQNIQRLAFPGVYKKSSDIIADAARKASPESQSLKDVWGVTRADLAEAARQPGNITDPGTIVPGWAAKPKGSEAAHNVMTKRNAERLVNTLGDAKAQLPQEFVDGMTGWYIHDPMYKRMVELMGPDEAKRRFLNLNQFGAIESPNLSPKAEMQRAFMAQYLAENGRWKDWEKFGGLRADARGADYPADMAHNIGRVGHDRAFTSQSNVLETGAHGMQSPKAPVYDLASRPQELGRQTAVPIGDAHWSRALGLGETRTNQGFADSVSTPELQSILPFYEKQIAQPLGMNNVEAQGFQWGVYGPQTGVTAKIGAPKLEIISDLISQRAAKEGVSPQTMRDMMLMAQRGGLAAPAAGGAAALAAALRGEQDVMPEGAQ